MPGKASTCHFGFNPGTAVSDTKVHKATAHRPVMVTEAVTALNLTQGGCYMDATYGRGGHSAAVLDKLDADATLHALDKDPAAVADGRARFGDDPRFHIHHADFATLDARAETEGIAGRLDGVLMDLGVSSPQLDEAERGFSFAADGALDMRMDPGHGSSAADWIADAPEEEIALILRDFGEERFARRIARRIVAERARHAITRTRQLATLIEAAVPRREPGKHPATRSFQAIRIHVNGELESLRAGLAAAARVLGAGGRLVVISFHSLEDRRVKRFMRDEAGHAPRPRGLPLPDAPAARLKRIGKPRYPTPAESAANPRARSAVMRVAEKLGGTA